MSTLVDGVAVAVLGARQHYAVARILQDAGRLAMFFTDSYAGSWPRLRNVMQKVPGLSRHPSVRRWLGRTHASLDPKKVSSSELLGFKYAWRRHRRSRRAAEVHVAAARSLARRIERQRAGGASIVWGLNGASLEAFRWAADRASASGAGHCAHLAGDQLLAPAGSMGSGFGRAGGSVAWARKSRWLLADGSSVVRFVSKGYIGVESQPRSAGWCVGVDPMTSPWCLRRDWPPTTAAGPLRGQVGLRGAPSCGRGLSGPKG
jgi:hypothetical protein